MFLNFGDYEDDKLNFICAIGCVQTQRKDSIEISEQPLIILDGIQYFLLRSGSCSPDIIKIVYCLCESLYVDERRLPEFQANLSRCIDVSETWDIRNYLYLVTNNFQSQSQVKTSAETKEIYQSFGYDTQKFRGKASISQVISLELSKYFSQVSVVHQSCVTQFGYHDIANNIEKNFDVQSSKWQINGAILKGCAKIATGPKIFPVKQFYKINTNLILDQFELKVMNNFQIFSFEMIRSDNRKKDYSGRKPENKSALDKEQRDFQRQREKEKNKIKDNLKSLKKNILLPFLEAQETWIGRTDSFKQRYLQVRQKIEQQCEKILVTLNQNDENLILKEIDNMALNQSSLDALGNSKFDGLCIRFGTFIKKIENGLLESLKANLTHKKWAVKDRPGNKTDMASNLDKRIEINERKKQSLETGIKLALKQYECLSALMQPDRKKMRSFQSER